ncbi:MAG: plsC 1 [Burkholderiaceae bacterium]|nr:plsC 1 [Burkholderiaceae bacterium]
MLSYLRAFFRLILFAVLVVIGLLVTLLFFPLIGWQSKRRIIKYWSSLLIRALGVRLVVDCAPPAQNLRGLMVSNHSSWIDIFATNAVQAVRFISKSEIRDWPVLGRLVTMAGTLYVERGNRNKINETNESIRDAVAAGDLVGFYPEGTTTDGTYLLPFKTNLFQPAVDYQMMVYPVTVSYRQRGEPTRLASYEGNTSFGESFLSLTRAAGLEVHVAFGDPIDSRMYGHRAALASVAQNAIAQMAGLDVKVPSEEQAALLQSAKMGRAL